MGKSQAKNNKTKTSPRNPLIVNGIGKKFFSLSAEKILRLLHSRFT